jgi:general secretion pathway protein C
MAARWFSFVIWAAVAASAAAWALRLLVPSPAAPLHASTVDMAPSARGDLTRLFGVDAAPVAAVAAAPADSRFRLIGVAAPRATGEGLALIAVDGKPPRAYRVGAAVDGDTVLQEVRARGATLGTRGGPAMVTLEIPPLPAAATGTLPAAPGGPANQGPGGFVPPPAMPPAQLPDGPTLPEATVPQQVQPASS